MAVRPLANVWTLPFQGAFKKELALTEGWSWNVSIQSVSMEILAAGVWMEAFDSPSKMNDKSSFLSVNGSEKTASGRRVNKIRMFDFMISLCKMMKIL